MIVRLACPRMSRPVPHIAAFILAGTALALSACASNDKVATPVDTGPAQPRVATYSCADGAQITIEFLGSAIRLLAPDGTKEEYPASPAGQQNRFGDGPNAVVIEGTDALVMHGNQTPLTCTR
jgi:hypothetical protein